MTYHFNLARVWLEALGWVLGRDAALDGKAAGRDAVLGEAKLLEGGASRDLDLRRDNVDAGDLLGDGVLDLDTGVDLDEIVAVLLIDEELGLRTSNVSDPFLWGGVGRDCTPERAQGFGQLKGLLTVPALRYPTDLARRTASFRIASRVAVGRSLAGAISTTF